MSLTRKTSLLSDARFPMFIRGNPDFDNMRRFLKSYFESLEEKGGASYEITYAQENSDIDTTTADFLDRMFKLMCPDLPTTLMADKRILLKHARELYAKKGTPESFKLLFRIMFNETVSLTFPNDNVIKASDGRWQQTVSLHVRMDTQIPLSIQDFAGTDIVCFNASGVVRNVARNIRLIKENLYEVNINRQKNLNFQIGDKLTIGTTSGYIVGSTDSIKIVRAGKKFRVGQLIELNLAGGTGTIAKVQSIDANGGITRAKLIKFGTGYTSNFMATVSPVKTVTNPYAPPVIEGATIPISESFGGFSESITVLQSGGLGGKGYVADGYFEPFYVGMAVSQFVGASGGGAGTEEDTNAILSVNIGAVLQYPGHWTTSHGMLSDPLACMQDNLFYQNFSYVIQSAVPRDKYQKVVTDVVHPAGLKFFSEMQVDNFVDMSPNITSLANIRYTLNINDIIDLPDYHYYNMVSTKQDTVSPIDRTNQYVMAGYWDGYVIEYDDVAKLMTRVSQDSFIVADKSDYFDPGYTNGYTWDDEAVFKTIAVGIDDTISLPDQLDKNQQLTLNDSFHVTGATEDYFAEGYVDGYHLGEAGYSANESLVFNTI